MEVDGRVRLVVSGVGWGVLERGCTFLRGGEGPKRFMLYLRITPVSFSPKETRPNQIDDASNYGRLPPAGKNEMSIADFSRRIASLRREQAVAP